MVFPGRCHFSFILPSYIKKNETEVIYGSIIYDARVVRQRRGREHDGDGVAQATDVAPGSVAEDNASDNMTTDRQRKHMRYSTTLAQRGTEVALW